MRKSACLVATLFGLFVSSVLAAPVTLSLILMDLKATPAGPIPFQEQRHIAALKAPLQSHGTLAFLPPETLVKTVEGPEPLTFWLSPLEIRITEGHQPAQSLSPESLPELDLLRSSLIALFQGDQAKLEAQWHIQVGGSEQHWTLHLVPRVSEGLELESVRLEGRNHQLQSLRIQFRDGSANALTLGSP
jgi:hypothetical protein